jgi:hypothetical protein
MSTPAQIAANQANSKLSTGPTTDIGKQIVSQNSVKHHLTGKGNPALPGEHDAVEEQVQGYFQTYAPVGLPEQDLVRNLAENNWRLQRCTLWSGLSESDSKPWKAMRSTTRSQSCGALLSTPTAFNAPSKRAASS